MKAGDKMMWGNQIVELTKCWKNVITDTYSWDTKGNENSPFGIPESELKPLIKTKSNDSLSITSGE